MKDSAPDQPTALLFGKALHRRRFFIHTVNPVVGIQLFLVWTGAKSRRPSAILTLCYGPAAAPDRSILSRNGDSL
jgi:hypothetical protein